MSSRKTEVVHSRIPPKLRDAMKTIIYQDTHINESDFIRVAIREKVERMAPHLIEIKEE